MSLGKYVGIGCLIWLVGLMIYLAYTAILKDQYSNSRVVRWIQRVFTAKWKQEEIRKYLDKKAEDEAEKIPVPKYNPDTIPVQEHPPIVTAEDCKAQPPLKDPKKPNLFKRIWGKIKNEKENKTKA